MNVADTKKLMFEIYRDPSLDYNFRVVYFTELSDHDKDEEIGNAMRGEHVYDGFILHGQSQEAKRAIAEILDRLNQGEAMSAGQITEELRSFMP